MTGRRRGRRLRKNPAVGTVFDVDAAEQATENFFSFLDGLFSGKFIQKPVSTVPGFDKHWRDLIMLCHPDKHGNSERSQEVTRWLIENRPNQ